MNCPKCGKEITQALAFCSECGTPLAQPALSASAPAGSQGTRDERAADLVHPHNPPQSPHLALLSLLVPGVPQMIFGQTYKGLVILLAFIVGVPTGCLALAVIIAALVDGYMVGTALQNRKPVGQWQFFPQ